MGGAYAFERYTGIERHTKDFDIFCRRADAEPILEVLESALGCRTEMTFPHWLGKAYNPATGDFIDVIYSSGSGIAVVDDEWFTHARPAEVLGIPARLCPAEEMIWSKAFIMERERYDGNDVAHLLHATRRPGWTGSACCAASTSSGACSSATSCSSGSSTPAQRAMVPGVGVRRAGSAGCRRRTGTPPPVGAHVPRHPALAGAVPGGHREVGLRGRAPGRRRSR